MSWSPASNSSCPTPPSFPSSPPLYPSLNFSPSFPPNSLFPSSFLSTFTFSSCLLIFLVRLLLLAEGLRLVLAYHLFVLRLPIILTPVIFRLFSNLLFFIHVLR
jgi:hypothetical protein